MCSHVLSVGVNFFCRLEDINEPESEWEIDWSLGRARPEDEWQVELSESKLLFGGLRYNSLQGFVLEEILARFCSKSISNSKTAGQTSRWRLVLFIIVPHREQGNSFLFFLGGAIFS
jgi:hypothetical protein